MAIMELVAGDLTVALDPEDGAKILAIDHRGWSWLARYDWRAPLPARGGLSYGDSTLDWLSSYRGGWDVLFPNAGQACEVEGIPIPFHGEVSRARWTVDEQSEQSVTMSCGARLPLALTRTVRVIDGREPYLEVLNEVANDSDQPQPYLLVEHPGFVCPPGTVIDVAAGRFHADEGVDGEYADVLPGSSGTWPLGRSRSPGAPGPVDLATCAEGEHAQRLLYLSELPEGRAAIRCPRQGRTMTLSWDLSSLPFLWLWQERHSPGFPWFGRADVVGVEPAGAWPADGLASAVARGMATVIGASETHRSWLKLLPDCEPAASTPGRGGVTP